MNSRSWSIVALALGGLAVASGAWAFARGDLRFALVIIVPVFYGSGVGALVPMALLMGAVGAWFASRVAAAREAFGEYAPRDASDAGSAAPATTPEPRATYGGVVMLGPLPIAFGNDRRLLVPLLVLALLVGLTFLALTLIR